MNLVVDIGNTRLKYAFFRQGERMQTGYEREEMFRLLEKYVREGEPVSIFLSGSGKIEDSLRSRLMHYADYWLEARPGMPLPVSIGYETPETLGFDRIAGCIGARLFFPDKEILVVDSGTAITYNYLSKADVFLGGNIAPGMEIRFCALHLYTDKLPYVKAEQELKAYGRNTHDAILIGVMKGILWEVGGCIAEFLQACPDGQVVVTGGNSMYLEKKLSREVFFEKYLGLYGLNEILEYNKKDNKT